MGDRQRRRHSYILPFLIAAALLLGGLWSGVIPQWLLPMAPLDLKEPNSWFLDLRLAALRRNPAQCQRILQPPVISAKAIAPSPIKNGCGWTNAVAMTRAGEARVSAGAVSCELAAAFAMWMEHSVQPAAKQYLGSAVASVQHMGVFACRNIKGSRTLSGFRSQHARANAIDVSGFTLANGQRISIRQHWKGDAATATFLHAIHDGACRYFRVALGPDFNDAHENHFHLDRGTFKSCR